MISQREIMMKYRSQLRAAMEWYRRGNVEQAKHFFAMSRGIVAIIGINSTNHDRATLVGKIIGVYK